VLLVDDVEGVDKWTLGLLDRVAHQGCVVRVTRAPEPAPEERRGIDAHLTLPPLAGARLRELFHGPDVFLHLREDSADELMRRTHGNAARIQAEVGAWVRAGLCHWEDGKLRITRARLDALRNGLDAAPVGVVPSEPRPRLTGEQEDLVSWIHLAGELATVPLLAAVSGLPHWRVEAQLTELTERGVLLRHPDETFEARISSERIQTWSPEQKCAAHLRLAEGAAPGSAQRVLHLVLAGEPEALVVATLQAVDERMRAGRMAEAMVLLSPALAAIRQLGTAAQETRLPRALAHAASGELDLNVLQAARFELERAASPGEVAVCAQIVSAAIDVAEGQPAQAVERLEALGVLADEDAEAQRLAGLVQAHRALPLPREEAFQERLRERLASGPVAPQLRLWQGLLAHRRGDHAGAVRVLESCTSEADPTTLVARTSLASSLLELGELERAARVAQDCRETAAKLRYARLEAHAARVERAARYRRCDAIEPQLELVSAALTIGDDELVACLTLTEAAVAWRREQRGLFTELTALSRGAVERCAADAGESRYCALLIDCLQAAAVWHDDGPSAAELAPRVCAAQNDRVRLQCAALLALTGARDVLGPDELAAAWEGAGLGNGRWRLEVLSPHELRRHLSVP
jgi:hypothetical protein